MIGAGPWPGRMSWQPAFSTRSTTDRPVWPRATYEQMSKTLGGDLPDRGCDPVEVVQDLARRADPGIAGGRFFGFVVGGELPAALGVDWLTSVWDQNVGLNSMAPSAAAAETVAGQWIVEALGLPRDTGVGLVTGAMMANFTCLSAARHAGGRSQQLIRGARAPRMS
jgi:glutamate/tyrosine decarboxylase-like PLP-dependent enzyme